MTHVFARMMMRFLNIRCTFENPTGETFAANTSLLVLANHISYVDVIVVNAFFPSVFVTSREIEATPALGHVTAAVGCAFIERRNKRFLHRDIDQLSTLLNDGFNVTLYPEGTTSAGDRVGPFKQSLLEAAVRSRCRVVPVCLRYEMIDGQPFDALSRDRVAWYGDMEFFPHLWQLMTTRSIDVRLTVLSEVAFRGHKSRKRLARDVQGRITARFHTP